MDTALLTALTNKVSEKQWKKHEIAEACVVLNGEQLSLRKYKLMHSMYNDRSRRIVYKTARQVTKTTTLSIIMSINCFFRRHFKSLYAAPLEQHVYRFSNLNIKPILQYSPLINTFTDTNAVRSVLVKSFMNGSIMHFGYCANGVDRLRGISVDEINWDEVQDLLYDNMPVVAECMSASNYKNQRFCGTPKSLENTMEHLWGKSSQAEPVVRCSRCGKDVIPDNDNAFKIVHEEGPWCYNCNRRLRLDDIINKIRWVHAAPDRAASFIGRHIPQIFTANNLLDRKGNWSKSKWADIIEKLKDYSQSQFANEVLGLSWDIGGRLITLSELKGFVVVDPDKALDRAKYINVCAGIDWGISSVKSFTVVVIMGLRPDLKWELLYHYKFLSTDILYQIAEIIKILIKWNVDIAGSDFGVGWTNNQIIRKDWCNTRRHKVSEYQYVHSKHILSWSKDSSRYMLCRTMSLNNLFFEMKGGKILFPNSPKIDEVFDDILAEYEEISESANGIRKLFRHSPSVPDDYLHAINFAVTASKQKAGMLMINYENERQGEQ